MCKSITSGVGDVGYIVSLTTINIVGTRLRGEQRRSAGTELELPVGHTPGNRNLLASGKARAGGKDVRVYILCRKQPGGCLVQNEQKAVKEFKKETTKKVHLER